MLTLRYLQPIYYFLPSTTTIQKTPEATRDVDAPPLFDAPTFRWRNRRRLIVVSHSIHASSSPSNLPKHGQTLKMVNKWKFETVSDVFFDPSTIQKERKDKIETQPSLGLLTRPYPSDDRVADDTRDWTRFYRYVKSLNEAAPEGVEYKILYLTRHGIGFHNIKHAEVGEDEWNVNTPKIHDFIPVLNFSRTTGL